MLRTVPSAQLVAGVTSVEGEKPRSGCPLNEEREKPGLSFLNCQWNTHCHAQRPRQAQRVQLSPGPRESGCHGWDSSESRVFQNLTSPSNPTLLAPWTLRTLRSRLVNRSLPSYLPPKQGFSVPLLPKSEGQRPYQFRSYRPRPWAV